MNNELQNNPVAKLVFDVLAERQRHRQRTDLNNLFRAMRRDNPDLSEKEYLEVFKTLQANGAGSLIIGRRGNPNRFIWKYNLKDLAEKVQINGLNPVTIKHLEMIKPESKAGETTIKRAKRPSFKTKRTIEVKPKVEKKTRKKRALVAKETNEVTTSSGTKVIALNVSHLSDTDFKALVELIAAKTK